MSCCLPSFHNAPLSVRTFALGRSACMHCTALFSVHAPTMHICSACKWGQLVLFVGDLDTPDTKALISSLKEVAGTQRLLCVFTEYSSRCAQTH